MMDFEAHMRAMTEYLRQLEGPLEPEERAALKALYDELVELLEAQKRRGNGHVS